MGQYYTTNNFCMEIKNQKDLEFAKKYTKNSCELYIENLFELAKKLAIVKNQIKYENNKFIYRLNTGEDIELSQEEINRILGCACVCDKIKINNWARYCDKSCPYYFNTKNLQKIVLGIDKE